MPRPDRRQRWPCHPHRASRYSSAQKHGLLRPQPPPLRCLAVVLGNAASRRVQDAEIVAGRGIAILRRMLQQKRRRRGVGQIALFLQEPKCEFALSDGISPSALPFKEFVIRTGPKNAPVQNDPFCPDSSWQAVTKPRPGENCDWRPIHRCNALQDSPVPDSRPARLPAATTLRLPRGPVEHHDRKDTRLRDLPVPVHALCPPPADTSARLRHGPEAHLCYGKILTQIGFSIGIPLLRGKSEQVQSRDIVFRNAAPVLVHDPEVGFARADFLRRQPGGPLSAQSSAVPLPRSWHSANAI